LDGPLTAYEAPPYELCHFEGADASTAIVDSGSYAQTVTTHGAAQIDTSTSSMGSSSLMLGSGDYISVDTGNFAFGTGDFCVDFYVKLSPIAAQVFYDGGASGFVIQYTGSALTFTSAAGTITGTTLFDGTDAHIAVTRASGSTRLFKNGTQTGSTLTDTTNYGATSGYPRIGGTLATVSGSLVVTEAADTFAATGTVTTAYDSATNAWITAVGSSNVDSTHAGYVDLITGIKPMASDRSTAVVFAAQNSTSAWSTSKRWMCCPRGLANVHDR
jgi:hypothetical protein